MKPGSLKANVGDHALLEEDLIHHNTSEISGSHLKDSIDALGTSAEEGHANKVVNFDEYLKERRGALIEHFLEEVKRIEQ